MTRSKANPGGKLSGVGEVFEVGDFGDDDLLGDFSKSRNGAQELLVSEKGGVLGDEGVDTFTYGGDFFFLEFDATLKRA